jgi:metal-dependent amidase/aminoacylase/carboxypeptidase family protein
MLVAASDRSDPVIGGFYKDIHAHPELAMQEERTCAKAAEPLEAAGFEAK